MSATKRRFSEHSDGENKMLVERLMKMKPAAEPGAWEVSRTDLVLNTEDNPNFKPLPAEAQAALEEVTGTSEPIYLGDLVYLLQRKSLDRYGRTYTFVPVVPEGLLVIKAAAQLLDAKILQAPTNPRGNTWGDALAPGGAYAKFNRVLRGNVRTPTNFIIHAEPKWSQGEETADLGHKGGPAVRFYSSVIAYVLRWGRLRTSIFVSKSRSLTAQHVYSFDIKPIVELASQYDEQHPKL